MGFGTRVYSSLNQVDIGLWEGDTLVKFASGKKYRVNTVLIYITFTVNNTVMYFCKVFENGMKYQLSQIIEEHLSFLEDDGVDYSEFLKSPNYPAKTFSMPSKSSLLGGGVIQRSHFSWLCGARDFILCERHLLTINL